ncbi:MAG: phenylalanine--tRNA ligase subunit beta [Desertimonas sp.]
MKLLYSWLGEYLDLSGHSDDDVIETLARLGLPVEEVIRTAMVAGVVTARVVRTERHPDAAKVIRVWVDAGDGAERHVWCGASNFGPGDVIPLATLGSEMPDGRTIERRGILGIDSEGMLCSANELGLGEDHSGIMVLPADTPIGQPYGDALGLADDIVLDVDVTRNRPDCYSYVGIARDLAAGLGAAFTPPSPPTPSTIDGGPSTTVEIVAGQACGRFTSTVLTGVRVGPSADWMQRRLTAAGMRPINNAVDVSNYVMLELGQPNHAYDLASLDGDGFRIRVAADGEELVTLDDVTRRLTTDDLLITDATDRPIGLAGIMGGANTEISDTTTTVALEMAWFEPAGIARSVVRSNLRSEASARFERGTDPYVIDTAIARFVELLAETCPGLAVAAGAVDARAGSLPPKERSTRLRVTQVGRILGPSIAEHEIVELLAPIGFGATPIGDGVLDVALPSWRPDSTDEIDVIEEVGRQYGYERLGKRRPRSPRHGRLSPRQQRRRRLREVLVGLGLSEVLPNPFLAPDTLARSGLDGAALRITNPLVADESVLRTSLRPGLLRAVAFNASHRRPGVSLFEIGHVYPPGDGELPGEYEALGVVLAGREAPDAMMVWREIAAAMSLGARIDQSRVPSGLHATRSATLIAGRDVIGAVGEVAPDVLAALDIDERVAVLELDLRVLEREPKAAVWKPTSRHPSSDLDLAFVLPDAVPADKLDKAIRQSAGNLLVGLELFDVFRGPSLGEDTRSLAYRLRLQAPDRNLTDGDIATVIDKVTAAAAKLGATRRG